MKYTKFVLVLAFTAVVQARSKDSWKFTKNGKSRVNLALETAFIFDPKDVQYDMNLIRTLRTFLDQLEDQLLSKSNQANKLLRKHPANSPEYILTDFLHDLGKKILNAKDDDIKRLAVELQNTLEDYYVDGTVFHKVIYDPRLKAFVKTSLKEWSQKDGPELRADINRLRSKADDDILETFVHSLDSFFEPEDKEALNKLLARFDTFPRSQHKLQKTLDQAVNFIVFDRYKNLSPGQKTTLINAMSKLTDYLSIHYRAKTNEVNVLRRDKGDASAVPPIMPRLLSSEETASNAIEFAADTKEDIIKKEIQSKKNDIQENASTEKLVNNNLTVDIQQLVKADVKKKEDGIAANIDADIDLVQNKSDAVNVTLNATSVTRTTVKLSS